MQPTLNYLRLVICLVRTFGLSVQWSVHGIWKVKAIGSTEKPIKLLGAKAKVWASLNLERPRAPAWLTVLPHSRSWLSLKAFLQKEFLDFSNLSPSLWYPKTPGLKIWQALSTYIMILAFFHGQLSPQGIHKPPEDRGSSSFLDLLMTSLFPIVRETGCQVCPLCVSSRACSFLSWALGTLVLSQSVSQSSRSVASDSLRPHELQHVRPPCPSPTPGVYSNSCPSSRWCHPAISSSVVPFSSCPKSLQASGSFPMSQLFTWGCLRAGQVQLGSVPSWSGAEVASRWPRLCSDRMVLGKPPEKHCPPFPRPLQRPPVWGGIFNKILLRFDPNYLLPNHLVMDGAGERASLPMPWEGTWHGSQPLDGSELGRKSRHWP